jgi:hypothetical protein
VIWRRNNGSVSAAKRSPVRGSPFVMLPHSETVDRKKRPRRESKREKIRRRNISAKKTRINPMIHRAKPRR